MGTYSIDNVTKYIDFYSIIKKRKAKYPFAIFSTAKENEVRKNWWSFLDIQFFRYSKDANHQVLLKIN